MSNAEVLSTISTLKTYGSDCIAKAQSAKNRLAYDPTWRDEVMLYWLAEADTAFSGAEAVQKFYIDAK